MLTAAVNKHYALECRRARRVHYIPIPRPSRSGISSSLPETSTGKGRVLVGCPECGLVSVYSESDVQVQIAPRINPFEADICLLVSVEVECDHEDCESPTDIHTILENDKGTWKQKFAPKDLEFSPECRCGTGHPLAPRWTDKIAWGKRTLLF